MTFDDEDELQQITYIPLPDGRFVSSHGGGVDDPTSWIRVGEPYPSDDAYVYCVNPDGILKLTQQTQFGNITPQMIPYITQTLLAEPEFQRHKLGHCKDYIASRCGRNFDEYMRQMFPNDKVAYSAKEPTSKDFRNLWKNRLLKIKFSIDCPWWVQGKVFRFKNSCAGPMSPCTRWFITIQLLENHASSSSGGDGDNDDKRDDFFLGQLVEVHGLKSAKQHNGKIGVITKLKNSDCRYHVQICIDNSSFSARKILGIKTDNMKRVKDLEREVGRMNVSGGGILIGEQSKNDLADKISFEWVDKADPHWEPKIYTIEDDEYQLQTLEMLNDPSELISIREKLHQEFADRTPSLYGPPDCNPDGSHISTPRRRAFEKYMKDEFGPTFFNLAKTDLKSFEELLMTQPLPLWNNNALQGEGMDELLKNVNASKVVCAVLKHRHKSGDVTDATHWTFKSFGNPEGCPESRLEETAKRASKEHYSQWHSNYASAIGKYYEDREVRDYGRAITWYNEAMEGTAIGYNDDEILSVRCHDVAATYNKMGLLSDSYRVFLKGTKLVTSRTNPGIHEVKDKMKKELKLWTGTSGYFLSETGDLRIDVDDSATLTSIVSLIPHAKVPPHFGDVNDSERWNPVPIELPRRMTLSALPASICNFVDQEAEEIFMEIYDGYFQAQWYDGDSGDLKQEDFPNIRSGGKFLAVIPHAQNCSGQVFTTYVVAIPIPGMDDRVFTAHAFNFEKPFNSKFTSKQKEILSHRVIHWFVRLLGVKIETKLVRHCCDFLRAEYTKKQNWEDAIDVAVIDADFAFRMNEPGSRHLFPALNHVGEALEESEEYLKAARVYAESARYALSKQEITEAATLFTNSGLAYRRCNDFLQAENQYVAGIHFHVKSRGDRLDFDSDQWDLPFSNMIANYDIWIGEKRKGNAKGRQESGDSESIFNMEENVYMILSCLLYRSGFQPSKEFSRTGIAVKKVGKEASELCLNGSCSTKTQCQTALKDAISSSPDVSVFHSKILAIAGSDITSIENTFFDYDMNDPR